MKIEFEVPFEFGECVAFSGGKYVSCGTIIAVSMERDGNLSMHLRMSDGLVRRISTSELMTLEEAYDRECELDMEHGSTRMKSRKKATEKTDERDD